MKKCLIALCLAFALALGVLPVSAAEPVEHHHAKGGGEEQASLSLGEDELPPIPTDKYTLEECGFLVTVPAGTALRCFNDPDSYIRYCTLPAEKAAYTLECNHKVRLSNGSVRYGFISEDDVQLYFGFKKDTMSVEVVHTFEETVTEPTCTEKGYTTKKCACGHEEVTAYTDMLEHKVETWSVTKVATCAEPGEESGICTLCRKLQTRQTESAEHSWTDATCTAPKTCSACGTTEGKPLSHSWQAADCVTPKTCTVCGGTEGEPKGHDWDVPDCTKPRTCKICQHSEGAALGHDWKPATCTDPKICKNCAVTEGAALGHSWKAATCTTAKTCKVCSISDGMPNGHSWDKGVVTREPTTENTGIKSYTCTVCQASRIESIPKLGDSVSGVTRLAGADRYKTAFLAADMLKQQLGVKKFDVVVVASGTEFADALSGSYLAAVKNAPMLLVRNNKATLAQVKDYIKANLASGGTVYILGGENAVPKSMESGLEGFTVKRLGGATRYDTNLIILKEAGVGDKDILVCTGKGFADSLSASAAKLPILLVKDSLNSAQKDFLKGTAGKKYVIGGTSAVNAKIETALKAYGEVARLGGNTRYETSVLVAKTFFDKPTAVAIAYAQNFPDGLSGGALAAAMDAPLILTANGKEKPAADYAKSLGIQDGYILGGNTLISDKTAKSIFSVSTITVK